MFNQYSTKYGIPIEGDIMVTGVGTLGICYVVKKSDRFYFKDGNIIWLKKKREVNSRFVEYAFKSDFLKKQIDNSIGATVGTYTIIKAKNTLIPLPPLPTQQCIVAILDEAFDAIAKAKANTEKNLKNAREVFDSYLDNVFANPGDDWEMKRLGEIANICYGYTEKTSFQDVGPKFLRITDIQNNNVNWEIVPFCKIENIELSKYQLSEGDIVFTRTGATTGKSFLIKNPPLAVFASYLIRLRLLDFDRLKPDFLFLFFQSSQYWNIIKVGLSGSTQGGFNATKLSEIKIQLPLLPTQQAIVAKLDELSAETKKLEAIYQKKLDNLEELKKSILQKAFNGELTD